MTRNKFVNNFKNCKFIRFIKEKESVNKDAFILKWRSYTKTNILSFVFHLNLL